MKSYIEAVTARRAAINSAKQAHIAGANEAARKADELRETRTDALQDGDREKYLNVCREIEFYEEKAKHEAHHVDAEGLTTENIIDIWESFAADYNKDFIKARAKVNELREKLARAYIALLSIMSEGNKEYEAARDDLKGRRLGSYNAEDCITPLETPAESLCNEDLTPEGIITVAALHLDAGRAENIGLIERGGHIDSINKESPREAIARAAAEKHERERAARANRISLGELKQREARARRIDPSCIIFQGLDPERMMIIDPTTNAMQTPEEYDRTHNTKGRG